MFVSSFVAPTLPLPLHPSFADIGGDHDNNDDEDDDVTSMTVVNIIDDVDDNIDTRLKEKLKINKRYNNLGRLLVGHPFSECRWFFSFGR